ncbi:hypothetical protein BH24CHL4_BH24CHL4_21530 [soil metagenome]
MIESSDRVNPGEVPCSYHPKVQTLLRCSRCGKPICPQCAVRTPVGLRCPDCAGVRGLPTYPTESGDLAKAALAGFVVALAVGVTWGYFPVWGFYLALALGFGVAESLAKLANHKRGLDLQVVGWLAVAAGIAVSRAVLAQRLGLSWDAINQMGPLIENQMHLRLLPDGVFAALPFLIVFIRFR